MSKIHVKEDIFKEWYKYKETKNHANNLAWFDSLRYRVELPLDVKIDLLKTRIV